MWECGEGDEREVAAGKRKGEEVMARRDDECVVRALSLVVCVGQVRVVAAVESLLLQLLVLMLLL